MKTIYKKIWSLAKPYYQLGRPMDIEHIKWMMKEAVIICKKERIDETILLPLAILHDVGYGVSNPVYFEKNKKKIHMIKGKKIAKKILEKVNYDKEKTKKICYLIGIHDNWIFGKYSIYKRNKILGTFQDLDFIWMISPKGFKIMSKILNKNREEMIEYIENDFKIKKIPFSTKSTENLFKIYLKDKKTS